MGLEVSYSKVCKCEFSLKTVTFVMLLKGKSSVVWGFYQLYKHVGVHVCLAGQKSLGLGMCMSIHMLIGE